MSGNRNITGLSLCRSFFIMIATGIILTVFLVLPAGAEELDSGTLSTGTIVISVGEKRTPMSISGSPTVEKMLDKYGITLGKMDQVTPPLNQKLKDGDRIKVTRRSYVTKTITGEIPFETIYYYSPDTTPGEEIIAVTGENGYGEQDIRYLLEDDKITEESVVAERLVKTPVTEEITIGFLVKPTSSLDFEWSFDENGEPIGAIEVFRNRKSTAYTARPNSLTASGMDAKVGHVAVNPNQIPYGSKLFIKGTDGVNLVYGYAIAADTGTALMDGRSHLDLYYDTMGECVEHGVKYVDIFVLETP